MKTRRKAKKTEVLHSGESFASKKTFPYGMLEQNFSKQ